MIDGFDNTDIQTRSERGEVLMVGAGFGVVTLVDPLFDEVSREGPWYLNSPRYKRFLQSGRGRRLLRADVLMDGHPIGPLNYFGPSSHTVPAGRHTVVVAVSGSMFGLADRMAGLGRRFPRVFGDLTEFEALRELLRFEPLDVEIRPNENLWLNIVGDPEGGWSLVPTVGRPEPAEPTTDIPQPSTRDTPSDGGAHGEIRLADKYSTELTKIIPVPYVAPGTQATWTATDADIESATQSGDGIRAQAGASLGMISLSLSRQFGASPSKEHTRKTLQALTLPLDGNISTAWEVRIYNVWQTAEHSQPGHPPTTFEYCSGSTAAAYPLSEGKPPAGD